MDGDEVGPLESSQRRGRADDWIFLRTQDVFAELSTMAVLLPPARGRHLARQLRSLANELRPEAAPFIVHVPPDPVVEIRQALAEMTAPKAAPDVLGSAEVAARAMDARLRRLTLDESLAKDKAARDKAATADLQRKDMAQRVAQIRQALKESPGVSVKVYPTFGLVNLTVDGAGGNVVYGVDSMSRQLDPVTAVAIGRQLIDAAMELAGPGAVGQGVVKPGVKP